jgi:gamma-glutamyltranspeptidase / glutathione hydrolase
MTVAAKARLWILRLIPLLLLAACAQPEQIPAPAPSPPPQAVPATTAWVSAANPHAVNAGVEILKQGGSALDAAIAIQTVLGLVEPQSSGIGGGAFLMYYDAGTRRITVFNGRETAPAGADPRMFLDENGRPLPRGTATTSGRAIGVPGVMRMLEAAHRKFGTLPWNETLAPAIRLAQDGFVISPRMGRYLGSSFPQANTPDVRALFARPDGSPLQVGDHFRNPAYASTLHQMAEGGADVLHDGPLAEAIVARARAAPLGGTMTLEDLERYSVEEVAPLCRIYLQRQVCVPPPPSSGVALLQLLGILEHTDVARRGPEDPQAWFLFGEASRLMYADRDRYVADPDFVAVPVEQMLEPTYLTARAGLIHDRVGPPPAPGIFAGFARATDTTLEAVGTSHFVVVDAGGNAVSMTTTVETYLGSGRVVGGFVLNNELTDFALDPVEGGRPAANAIAGGKRPRSSMAPVIVLDLKGNFIGALGSPGGNAILAYNGKTLLGTLAWGLPLQQAIDLPNLIARGKEFAAETSRFPQSVVDGLAARGAVVTPGRGEESGIHGVFMGPDGKLMGGADPRREGFARSLGGASE